MPRKIPTPVLVIATLSIIFGSAELLCNACGGILKVTGGLQAFQENRQHARLQAQIEKEQEKIRAERLPSDRLIVMIYLLLNLVCGAMLLISGIGLLRLASWARTLALVYALLSMSSTIGNSIYDYFWRRPLMLEALDKVVVHDEQERKMLDMIRMAGNVGPLFGCLILLYPLVVCIIMLLPSVRKAFTEAPSGSEE